MQPLFKRTSGRVTASARALLAAFFVAVILLDPRQPDRPGLGVELLLGWYALWSFAYAAATWNDWWLERRLGGPAHAVDIVVFTFLVFLTGGVATTFFTFSVFLVLSATTRWGWREATLTSILVVLLFVAAAATGSSWQSGGEFDFATFAVRGSHLIVMMVIIIGLGASQQLDRAQRLSLADLGEGGGEGPPIDEALRYAASLLRARRVVLAWWEADEPWSYVSVLDRGQTAHQRLGPQEMESVLVGGVPDGPLLFDLPRERILLREGADLNLLTPAASVDPQFAARFGITEGIRVPIRADTYSGELLALEVKSLSADDLGLAERLALLLAAAFERSASVATFKEAAATRERLSFARDLHDSVMQFLAGMTMRLDGLRKAAPGNEEVQAQVTSLQDDLRHEQRDLRSFITALRGGAGPLQTGNVSQELAALVSGLGRRWGVACTFETAAPGLEAPVSVRQDIDLLVREAVSNAVRHGKARRVRVTLDATGDWLQLLVADDGHGFRVQGEFDDDALRALGMGPWSLQERVHKRAGSLHLCSSGEGSTLTMRLPMRGDGQ